MVGNRPVREENVSDCSSRKPALAKVEAIAARAERKRAKTHEHFEHEDSKGIPVDTLVVSTRLYDLGSEVVGRTYVRGRKTSALALEPRRSRSARSQLVSRNSPQSVQVISGTCLAKPKSVILT